MPPRSPTKPPLQPGDIWEGISHGYRTRRKIVAIDGRDVRWVAVGLLGCKRSGIVRAATFVKWARVLIRRQG